MGSTRLQLAVYDSAFQASDGTYWAWRHIDLPLEALDRCYYGSIRPNLPDDLCDAARMAKQGGFVAVDDQWCCWYRFASGGRDTRGRPGRYLILVALARRADVRELDSAEVFHEIAPGPWFARTSQGGRVSLPQRTEIELALSPSRTDPVQLCRLMGGRPVKLDGANSLAEGTSLCAHLPDDFDWSLKCEGLDETKADTLTVVAYRRTQPGNSVSQDEVAERPQIEASTDSLNAQRRARANSRGKVPRWTIAGAGGLLVALLVGLLVGPMPKPESSDQLLPPQAARATTDVSKPSDVRLVDAELVTDRVPPSQGERQSQGTERIAVWSSQMVVMLVGAAFLIGLLSGVLVARKSSDACSPFGSRAVNAVGALGGRSKSQS